MRKRDPERALRELGWWLLRQGGRHEVWTNGTEQEVLPRHREIADPLAQRILPTARRSRGATR
ncbi:MAG: type II toxin-antitoxin system HicA family toxin [Candidatus Latescibacterota bacterium]